MCWHLFGGRRPKRMRQIQRRMQEAGVAVQGGHCQGNLVQGMIDGSNRLKLPEP